MKYTPNNGGRYTNGTAVEVVLWKPPKRRNDMKEVFMMEILQQMLA